MEMMPAAAVRVSSWWRGGKKRRQDAAGEILLLLPALKEEANGEAEPRAPHSQAEQSVRGLGRRTGLNGTGSPVVRPVECSLPPAASLSLSTLAGVNPSLLSPQRGFQSLGRQGGVFSLPFFVCLFVCLSRLQVKSATRIRTACRRIKGPLCFASV